MEIIFHHLYSLALFGSPQNTNITGNLSISGTVAGRDVAADGSILDGLIAGDGIGSLTTAEITQLQNIDVTTITSTQWGYLGSLNQALSTTNDVEFANIETRDIQINANNAPVSAAGKSILFNTGIIS